MKLLLDTHVLLWWLDGGQKLHTKAKELISEPSNIVFLSSASIWEIRIKESIGKLIIPKNFQDVLITQSFEELPISVKHAHSVINLPRIHRDPFDRILISQAYCEDLTIISHDDVFEKYPIKVVLT